MGPLVAFGLILPVLLGVGGCATPASDDYVDQIIAEALATSSEDISPSHDAVIAPVVVRGPSVVAESAKPVTVVHIPEVSRPVETVKTPSEVGPAPTTVAGPVVTPAASTPTIPVSQPVASKDPAVKPSLPTIQPESVLWVSVEEDPSLNGRYLVNTACAIDFGYVGLVFLKSMTVEQAELTLKQVLEGRYLNRATVNVKIAKASYDRIQVIGAVELPGDVKIGAGVAVPLNEALNRAGGLRGQRDSARVKVVRNGMMTPFGPAAPGEVYALTTSDGKLQVPDVMLRNNDLVYVFAFESQQSSGGGGKRILLLGEVPRRGTIDFADNEPCTVMYLLFKIGGLPRFARSDRIEVVRTAKDGRETRYLINGENLMKVGDPRDDLVLESGDRVIVPARRFAFF